MDDPGGGGASVQATGHGQPASNSVSNSRRHNHDHPHMRPTNNSSDVGSRSEDKASNSKRGHRNSASRQRKPATPTSTSDAQVAPDNATNTTNTGGSRRQQARHRFGASLTASASAPETSSSVPTTTIKPQPKRTEASATDLTSHLTNLLRTPPYPDCPICYSSVHPLQPTWSCSVDSVEAGDGGIGIGECCWTTFHLKCIKAWAGKSVKETEEAYLARGQSNPGSWRCPNCQSKRTVVPSTYLCFCLSTPHPHPPRNATPHSCALPCTRKRKGCEHPCTLHCHPGPCPPCGVALSVECWCGKEVQTVKCKELVVGGGKVSCQQVCRKVKACGDPDHQCGEICHPNGCQTCDVKVEVRCPCQKESKEFACGQQNDWKCEQPCGVAFACGIHKCERLCHPHLPAANDTKCPFDPENVTTCPCGTTQLQRGSRSKCADPIPTCNAICGRSQSECDHGCPSICHTGPCPPCSVPVLQACRCGVVTTTVQCHQFHANLSSSADMLCSTPCPSLRSCGRHQCTTKCCPAAHLGSSAHKKKSKKKVAVPPTSSNWEEELERLEKEELEREWHTCDFVCGKLLSCGIHNCEERDHKGACPPCLRSSFDELICPCGETVLLPPIPCGTKIRCSRPCSFPGPECGHSKVPHTCHDPDISCPPCPYLVSARCMCGKKEVDNIRCHLARSGKVGCGVVCGKTMNCGWHTCEKLCHSDKEGCGKCQATCGKDRRGCLPNHHPCTLQCHAPAACDESTPCTAVITLTCSCGRIQKPAPCLRSSSPTTGGPSSHTPSTPFAITREPKCTAECAIAARNARLADALGISQEVRERAESKGREVEWSAEVRVFGRANARFVEVVEKAFSDFIQSDKKTTILPAMPESKRKFVQSMAEQYRLSATAIDAEPRRSIQLARRIDSRIPIPLLSSLVGAGVGTGLGRLGVGDLRGSPSLSSTGAVGLRTMSTGHGTNVTTGKSPSSTAMSSASSPATPKGWSTVAAAASGSTSNSNPTPSTSSTAWGSAMDRSPPGLTLSPKKVVTSTPVLQSDPVPEDWETD